MGSCISRPINKEHRHHPSAVGPPKLQEFISAAVSYSGSKDETFFDSQPWLDSDCDDDFYSTNGDYTPSRGNTPVHGRFSTGTPLVRTPSYGNAGTPRLMKANSTPSRSNTPLHVNFAVGTPESKEAVDNELASYTPELSSTGDKKKRLSELFRLSRGGYADENIIINENKSADAMIATGPVFTSVPSSARTLNASSKTPKNKALKSVHPIGCIPKLRTVRHKNEKGMDVNTISEQGHKSEGSKAEV